MNYILIDYENIQPKCLNGLSKDYHVWLLIGNLQGNIPESLEHSLKWFDNVKKVKLQKTAKNALDFILFQYVGQIINHDKNANILIISNDTGFDVPIEFLKNNHQCQDIRRIGKDELSIIIEKPISQIPQILKNNFTDNKPKNISEFISLLNNYYTTEQIYLWLEKAQEAGFILINDNQELSYHFTLVDESINTDLKVIENHYIEKEYIDIKEEYIQSEQEPKTVAELFTKLKIAYKYSDQEINLWIDQAIEQGLIFVENDGYISCLFSSIEKPIYHISWILNHDYEGNKPKTVDQLIFEFRSFGYTEKQIRSWIKLAEYNGTVSIDKYGYITYLSALEILQYKLKNKPNKPNKLSTFFSVFARVYGYDKQQASLLLDQAQKLGLVYINDTGKISYLFVTHNETDNISLEKIPNSSTSNSQNTKQQARLTTEDKKIIAEITGLLKGKLAKSRAKRVDALVKLLKHNKYTEKQTHLWIEQAQKQKLISINDNGEISYLFSANNTISTISLAKVSNSQNTKQQAILTTEDKKIIAEITGLLKGKLAKSRAKRVDTLVKLLKGHKITIQQTHLWVEQAQKQKLIDLNNNKITYYF